MRLPIPTRATGDDLVPLINVVFLLLIFFLLAGTLMPSPPVAVHYIESDSVAVPSIPPGAIFVDAAGRLYVDGSETSGAALAAGLGAHGDAPVQLVLDRDVPMARVGPLFDALSAAGAGRVEIVTVRGKSR